MPVGFLNLSILWVFLGGGESFSYATSVKRASALFYIKTLVKNPHKVDKMAQLVTADPRLSWWKERTNSTQLTSDLYPCAQNK